MNRFRLSRMPDARILCMLWILATMALPFVAIAQQSAPNPDVFTPGEQDLTNWILKSIFGDWTAGGKIPMLGGAFEMLNYFALSFGSLLFTYVSVVGTMYTAHDGQLLGKRWGSMWLPIRFMLGAGALTPLSTGYCTAQHLCLWLALMGGGGASSIWGMAVENFAGSQATEIQTSDDHQAKVQALMRDVLKAEICTAMKRVRNTSADGVEAPYDLQAIPSKSSRTFVAAVKWGATDAATGDSEDVCGTVVTTAVSIPEELRDFTLTTGDKLSSNGSINSVSYTNGSMSAALKAQAVITAKRKAMAQAQQNAIMLVAKGPLRQLAVRFAKGEKMPSNDEIAKAIASAANMYTQATLSATSDAVAALDSNLTAFTDSAKSMGWITAGSSFFQMARIRSAAQVALNDMPSSHVASVRGDTAAATASVDQVPLLMDIAAMETQVDKSFQGDTNNLWNPGEKFALGFGKAMSIDPASSNHALVQIKNVGDAIIVGAEAAAMTGIAASVTVDAAGNTILGRTFNFFTGAKDTIKDALSLILPAIYGGFLALFGVGITMAFVLPMMPFTMSIGAVLGWLMALGSAMVAIPIWIAGHFHPDGDDVAGKGVGGYMILLETLTRPIFIVFGQILAFKIMDPMLKLTALLYRATVHGQEGDSTVGVVSIAVLAILYCSLTWTTIRSTLSLTYVLSETVYRWIGGMHAGYEQAREFEQRADMAGQAGTGGLQQVGGYVSRSRYHRSQERNAAREKRRQRDEPSA